ncbi:unnamed protein product [Boreogadus saida]
MPRLHISLTNITFRLLFRGVSPAGYTPVSQAPFPPEPSQKRYGSAAAVFRTAIHTRSGPDTLPAEIWLSNGHNVVLSKTPAPPTAQDRRRPLPGSDPHIDRASEKSGGPLAHASYGKKYP